MRAPWLSPDVSYRILLVVLFGVALALPSAWLAATSIAGWRAGDGAVLHIVDLGDAERRFEAAFPFRKPYWRVHNRIRHALFGAYPASVVSGQNGWWFYRSEAAEDGPGLNDRAGRAVPSAAEVERWRAVLERRRAWLAGLNVIYVPVIAPNKHTIYPDQLPAGLLREQGETRLDRFMRAVGPWPSGLLDLRPPLLAARRRGEVYLLTDTHWNDEGAYVAYAAIVAAVRTALPSTPFFEQTCFAAVREAFRGDIVTMASLAVEEAVVRLRPDPMRCVEERAVAQLGGPAILLFGDSYAARLSPFLQQSARRFAAAERLFGQADVLAFRPDVVVHEIAERHLDAMFDEAPPDRLRVSR